jgi:hypothetical protein
MQLTEKILAEIGFKDYAFTTKEYIIDSSVSIHLTWDDKPFDNGKHYSKQRGSNCTVIFKDVFHTRSIPTLPIETVEELKELFVMLHNVELDSKVSFDEILKRETA